MRKRKVVRDSNGNAVQPPLKAPKERTCRCCGRTLPIKEFGSRSNFKVFKDGKDFYCKECRNDYRKKNHAKRSKAQTLGIYQNKDGILLEYNPGTQGCRLHWGETKKREFKFYFPFHTNEDCAIKFECSPRTIVRRAREMGLEKDPYWLKSIWEEHRKMAQDMAKITHAHQDLTAFIEGGKKHRFKPGEGNGMTHEQRSEILKKGWQTRRRNKMLGII